MLRLLDLEKYHSCCFCSLPISPAVLISLYTCYHSNQGWGGFFSVNNLEACIFHGVWAAFENPNDVDGCLGDCLDLAMLLSVVNADIWTLLKRGVHPMGSAPLLIQIRMKGTTCCLPKEVTCMIFFLWCFWSLCPLWCAQTVSQRPAMFPNIKTCSDYIGETASETFLLIIIVQ